METTDVRDLPKGQSAALAVKRFKRFWHLHSVPSVLRIRNHRKDRRIFVGLGRSPAVYVSSGPKHRPGKQRKVSHSHRMLLAKPSGNALIVWNTRKPLPKKPKLRFVGYVHQTDYLATRDIDSSGSTKARTYWKHLHSDSNGRWPKLYVDQFGNWYYRGGTLRIGKWLYR